MSFLALRARRRNSDLPRIRFTGEAANPCQQKGRKNHIPQDREVIDLKNNRWLTLIASCFVTLCVGSLYAWSAFASPMGVYLSELSGREITSLAIVFTVANSVGPITMISGGFVNDRLGPRWILLPGGLLFGGGMIASGFARSVGMLVVTYGLGVGLGLGMIYGVVVSNAVKFFPDKGGFAGGLITACYGVSSIIVPPIANALAEAYHVTVAFKAIGIVMTIIICASAFIIRACPPDFRVEGAAKETAAPLCRDYDYREMLKEPDAYLMLLTLMCGAFAGMMVISQASQIAQKMMGMTPAAAAVVVSVIALFNTLGRLVSGVVSDRLGATGTLRITFAASLLASVFIFFCTESSAGVFCICLAVIGFAFGGIMGVYPGFTAQRFGRRNNSVNYGVMFIGFALAGLIGPMVMNAVFNAAGRYQPAFLASAFLAAAGEILLALLRRNQKRM